MAPQKGLFTYETLVHAIAGATVRFAKVNLENKARFAQSNIINFLLYREVLWE